MVDGPQSKRNTKPTWSPFGQNKALVIRSISDVSTREASYFWRVIRAGTTRRDWKCTLYIKIDIEDFLREDFYESLLREDFFRSLLFRSFLQLRIYERRLLKKSTLQKTSWEFFLCKYWFNFELKKFSKMPEKTSREVFSDKHVSFAIDWSLLETWLFIKDFSEVFLNPSQCCKKSTWNTFAIDYIWLF